MSFLIFSVLFNSGLNILFKYFTIKHIDLFKVILINYFVCFAIGQALNGAFISAKHVISTTWFNYALILGFIFIVGFNLAGMTVKYFGITIATMMQKMSLILTISFALIYYDESFSLIKAIGLTLAVFAVVLTNLKNKEDFDISQLSKHKFLIFLPIATFLLSGLVEVLFLFVDRENIVNMADHEFVTVLFGIAGTFAFIYFLIGRLTKHIAPLNYTEIIAGITLGVVNYSSIYFLLKMVQTGWEGSFIFPINNVAILILSASFSILFFYEKLSRINYLGLVLSIFAILLIWGSSL